MPRGRSHDAMEQMRGAKRLKRRPAAAISTVATIRPEDVSRSLPNVNTDELFEEGFLSPFLNVFRKGTSAVESATHVVTKSIGEVFFAKDGRFS